MLHLSRSIPTTKQYSTDDDHVHASQVKNDPKLKTIEEKIKLLKYPTQPFMSVIPINYWITQAKSSVLERSLNKTLKTENGLNFLRKVRGDGNCFIRAIAFQYLSHIQSTKIEKCFTFLQSVQLTISDKKMVPKKFIQFYNNDLLNYCLKQNWQAQYEKNLREHENNRKLALTALFATNPYLDFIVVLYMRAVSVMALRKFAADPELKGFLQDVDENKLRNYGNFSDGVTHFLLNRILSIEINIFEVRNEKVITYSYPSDNKQSLRTNLLYHDNHYDILEKKADHQSESNNVALKRSESYYSNLGNEVVEAECMNCQELHLINVQTCLCQDCFTKYKRALEQYSMNIPPKSCSSGSKSSLGSCGELQEPGKKVKMSQQGERKKRIKKHRLFGCFG